MIDGERSGGTRFNTEKPGFFWAVPLMGLRLIARVTAHGAKKYAPLDWAEGQSFSTLLDCIVRHLLEVLAHGPRTKDAESGCYSMAHIGWNVLCLLHFIEQERWDLDDVTGWRGVTTAERDEKDMNVLREGETGEASFEIIRESNPPEDDKVYVGPLQWAGPEDRGRVHRAGDPMPRPIQWPKGSPLREAQEAVEVERSFAPTGLKGFVHEANSILDEFERTSENRAMRETRRELDRVIHGTPTDEDLDKALRRTIIERTMDDTEATADMEFDGGMKEMGPETNPLNSERSEYRQASRGNLKGW